MCENNYMVRCEKCGAMKETAPSMAVEKELCHECGEMVYFERAREGFLAKIKQLFMSKNKDDINTESQQNKSIVIPAFGVNISFNDENIDVTIDDGAFFFIDQERPCFMWEMDFSEDDDVYEIFHDEAKSLCEFMMINAPDLLSMQSGNIFYSEAFNYWMSARKWRENKQLTSKDKLASVGQKNKLIALGMKRIDVDGLSANDAGNKISELTLREIANNLTY